LCVSQENNEDYKEGIIDIGRMIRFPNITAVFQMPFFFRRGYSLQHPLLSRQRAELYVPQREKRAERERGKRNKRIVESGSFSSCSFFLLFLLFAEKRMKVVYAFPYALVTPFILVF